MKKNSYAITLLGSLALTPVNASTLIEEVVVTAQKREQNLQDVSVSVSAYGSEQLEALGVQEPTDIVQFTPNVNFQDTGGNDVLIVRGISLQDFGDANESPVGFYVDDVYKATLGGRTVQFYDLDRIEVLRGPQGTLFGRNTTGGLIHAVTKKPTDEFEFNASVQGGSFGQHILETAISGPLTENIRGRLAYKFNRDEGYQTNLINGRRFAATDAWAVRGHLDIDLADDVSLLLSASLSEQRLIGKIFNVDNSLLPPAISGGFLPPGPSNPVFGDAGRVLTDLTDADDDTDLLDLSARLTWDLADNLTLTSITAYGEVERSYDEEISGATDQLGFGPAALISFRGVEAKQWTQELRLTGTSDEVTWVSGLYYFSDEKDDGFATRPVPALFFVNQYALDTESWAVFGQADISLNETLTLIAGVRYSEDAKDLDLSGDSIDEGPFSTSPDIDTDSVTWKLGLDWQVSDETLLYASVASGFKSGAFTTTEVLSPGGAIPTDEEEVVTYELGWKTTLFDGSARFNGAFFYTDYTDAQGVEAFILPSGAPSTRVVNFGDAKIYGAELELTVAPTENLELLFTGGWLETEYVDTRPILGGGENPLEGQDIAFTPQFTFGATGIYTCSLGEAGTLRSQLSANWSDQFQGEPASDSSIVDQDEFWLLDARVTWVSPDEKVSVSVFGENLTDEDYLTGGFDVGISGRLFAKPATWGVKVAYNY